MVMLGIQAPRVPATLFFENCQSPVLVRRFNPVVVRHLPSCPDVAKWALFSLARGKAWRPSPRCRPSLPFAQQDSGLTIPRYGLAEAEAKRRVSIAQLHRCRWGEERRRYPWVESAVASCSRRSQRQRLYRSRGRRAPGSGRRDVRANGQTGHTAPNISPWRCGEASVALRASVQERELKIDEGTVCLCRSGKWRNPLSWSIVCCLWGNNKNQTA